MLKKTAAMLTVLALLCAGCSGAGAPSAAEVSAALSVPFSRGAEIAYGEGARAAGRLEFSPAETVLTLESPEPMAGLSFTLNGEGETLSLDGMEKRLPTGTLPKTSPVKLISAALASAAAGSAEISWAGGEILAAGKNGNGAYTLRLAPETLLPVGLAIPGAGINVTFTE